MDAATADRFALDRQVRNEARERLGALADCKNLQEPLFVTEWFDDGTNIVGVGCTRHRGGETAKLTLDVKPGLFLVSGDVQVLRTVAALLGFPNVIEYTGIRYEANNFNLYDIMCDPQRASDAQLVKIETPTFLEAVILYHRLKRDPKAYRYASVTHYWDATKQVLFELIVRRHHQSHDYAVPKLTYRWFNSALQVVRLPEPKLPVITFDIETVSTDPDRVPTGEDVNDVLFTASVHHVDKHTVYTLVYLPVVNRTPQSLKEEMLRLDSYPDYGTETNVLEVFTSEVDLLRRTMDLLHLNGRHHYLVGYNSLSYDIKYLLVRCHFYGLHTDRFVWKDGYTFGFDQIHVDMFRIALMRYTYKAYTLSNVSKQLLKDDKVDVDAVALRYTFHRMRKRQRLYAHDDPEGVKNKWPSLRDTLHYNNYDTLLVSKLIERTRAIDYLVGYAHECRVPLYSMNTNYNKMQYKVLNECLVLGLGQRKFLSTFKTSTADMVIPLPDLSQPTIIDTDLVSRPHDYVMVSQNLDTLITNKPAATTPQQHPYGQKPKNKYPGGANFCLGEHNVSNVQSYDYRIAYPLLIDRKNLSDETADVMPADKLVFMFDYIFNRHQYTVYDYMTHVGDTKSETKILYYQYLYCGTYCGGQFPFTKCELQRRGTAPVIIVWHGRRGVMSDIITVFNDNRENTKNKRKTLDGVLAKVEATLQEFTELEEYTNTHNNETTVVESTPPDGGDFGFDDGDFGCDENYDAVANCAEDDGDFGDDDGDFVCDETNNEPTPPPPPQPQTNTAATPEKFRFENDIIQVFGNGLCFIDETALRRTERPVAVLKQLLHDVGMERDECESSYRLQKSRVASIYGCIGSLKPRLAALITCMIRTTLLQSGRYLIEHHGCTVYYCDTDSLFIVNPSGEDMSATLNQMYPHTEIEMKLIERCMFVQTKIYYYWSDGKIKYGHNTNGPRAWHDMVEHFVNLTTITTVGDVYRAFADFFASVYRHILDDTAGPGLDGLLRVTQDIKVKSNYKTMTPANELKIYLSANYPASAGAFRQNVYYYQQPQDVTKTVYRPSIELVKVDATASPEELRRLKLERLRRVNLFKYYYNMFKTIFNIVKFHIKRNNEPYNVTLNDGNVRFIMLRAYLDVTETNNNNTDNGTVEQMALTLSSSSSDNDDDED